jgi:hypothetical protein
LDGIFLAARCLLFRYVINYQIDDISDDRKLKHNKPDHRNIQKKSANPIRVKVQM